MANFPGNPHEDNTPDSASADAVAVVRVIELLAFEVRTLSLATMGASDVLGAQAARSEARERLGL